MVLSLDRRVSWLFHLRVCWQTVEEVRQRCSISAWRLNVWQRVRFPSSLAAALPNSLRLLLNESVSIRTPRFCPAVVCQHPARFVGGVAESLSQPCLVCDEPSE
jgi:hypothetical protein